VTREPVEAADKGRGYEYAKNSYLLIEEVEAIEVESNHIIAIDSFVPRSQIDERFLDSPYYIGPSDPVGRRRTARPKANRRLGGPRRLRSARHCHAAQKLVDEARFSNAGFADESQQLGRAASRAIEVVDHARELPAASDERGA
jgi:hypothetical protein